MAEAPAPFSVEPSWSFDGDDGSWSTFSVSVGTPPQSFRVLPSTTGAETWIPLAQGCGGTLANVANCGSLRGADDFDGKPSKGFQTQKSSTWDLIGTYELVTEQNLWGSSGQQGLYGLDTVEVERYPLGKPVKLKSQTVAGVITSNVWLGSLGLGTASASFSIETQNTPSLLESLKNESMTPSLSFGYTAGASYTQTPGSLIFGGYDQARFTPTNLSLPVGGYKTQNLPLTIQSIVAENTLLGITSMQPNGKPISTILDSTVPELWLPQSVCDRFAQAFGLTYNAERGLYLVNSTIHTRLKQLNPSITFTITGQDPSSGNTNIALPYAAFDLQASIPLFNYTTNYFPLRVAASESQQVLGRAFLQEAYVFVDWERKNFTLGQAIHQNKTSNIITVLPPSASGSSSSGGLSSSAIVGLAATACVLLAIGIAVLTYFLVRARRKRVRARKAGMPVELSGSCVQLHEMSSVDTKDDEVVGTQISELQGEALEQELEGDGEEKGRLKETWDSIYELP